MTTVLTTKTEEMKTDKFITCECHGHGLYMDYYIEQKSPHLSELYITMFGDKGYFEKPNLWQRIKAAFKTLKTGWFPGGELVLNEDNAAELKAYIGDFLIKSEI